jgi:hypothetical protein
MTKTCAHPLVVGDSDICADCGETVPEDLLNEPCAHDHWIVSCHTGDGLCAWCGQIMENAAVRLAANARRGSN